MDKQKLTEELQSLKNVWEGNIIDMEHLIDDISKRDHNGNLLLKDGTGYTSVELDLLVQQHQNLMTLLQLCDKRQELLDLRQ